MERPTKARKKTDVLQHEEEAKGNRRKANFSSSRLIGIVIPVVGGVCIIIAIVGGTLWHISQNYRGFIKVPIGQNGNVVSGGHGDSDNVLQIRFTGHNEPRSAEEIAQALSQHSLGHAPEQATEQATDGLNENSGLAAYQEISTDVLNEGLPSEAQSRPGTSRRNKSDRLPASIPAARCSWSKDENAYSELGNFSIQTEKKAVPAKPSFPVRPYGRKVAPSTDGGDCSKDSFTWSREKDKHKPPLPIRQNHTTESVSAYAVNNIVEPTRSSIKKYAKPANRVRNTPKTADVRNTSRKGATTKHIRRFGESIGSTVVTGETTKAADTAELPAISSSQGEPVYFIVHPEPSSEASSDNGRDE
ncbi:uncharacterized protein LOC117302542 [Asterias rubens]|uniref:uncharacterized protein LOC117302542 n=1 Tax=Asterias rubens TaxID=7604 RepID=UPI0014555211|nr:uncharacterized protein LOC117302542 [Asterias rubens]